jgi:hypothetical protein
MTLLLTGFGDRYLTTLRRERPLPEEVIVENPQLEQQPAEEAQERRGHEEVVMRTHEIEVVSEARLRITERMCANCSHEHHQMTNQQFQLDKGLFEKVGDFVRKLRSL